MQWTVERAEPLEDLYGRVPDDMRGWTPQPDAVPVFSCPSTLGCVLALVREVHGIAAVVYLPRYGAIRCWRVVTFAHGADWLTPARLFGEGATEAEALVAALECAP